jgi:hypothetical protein
MKPPESKPPAPLDPTKYHGPRGAAPPGSGVPATPEEEREWLRRADEAEQREIERGMARSELIRLTDERDTARRANDLARAEALSRERDALAAEIKRRFG